MKKKIKFGVVGLGHIGIKHVDAILSFKESEIVAIVDKLSLKDLKVKTAKNLEYLEKFQFFEDIDQICNHQEIDVVSICSPNGLHFEMAMKIILSKKHVLIEKPMTLNSNHARILIETANKMNKIVFCVMQNRFSPTIAWLKNLINKKKMGKVFSIHVNCFWNRNMNYYINSDWHGKLELDGGPLYTQFSHFIDILFWLFGDFSNIKAEFFNFRKNKYIEFEDSGCLNFNFAGGIKGTLNYSTCTWEKNFESSIIVLAEKGTVKIGGQYMDKLEYCNIENYNPPNLNINSSCNDYGSYKGSAANHRMVIENLINVILKGDNVATSGEEGSKIVQIIEKIYSLRTKKKKHEHSK